MHQYFPVIKCENIIGSILAKDPPITKSLYIFFISYNPRWPNLIMEVIRNLMHNYSSKILSLQKKGREERELALEWYSSWAYHCLEQTFFSIMLSICGLLG